MGKHTKDESGKSHKNSRDKLQKRDKKQKHKKSKSKIKARHKSAKRNRADLEYEASPQRRPRVSLSLSRSPSPLRTAWPTAPQHRIRSVAVLVPDRLHPAPAVDLAAEPQRSAAAQEAPEANGIAASHRKLDYARRDGSPATEPSRPSVITVHGESPANLRRMALQGMRKHIGQSQQINGDAPQKDSVGQYGNSLQMQGSSDIRANMFSTPRNLQQPDDTDTRHDKAQSTSRQQLQSPDQPAARSSDYQHGRTSPEDDKNHRPSRGHSPHRPTARSIDYYHGYSSQKNDRDHTPLDVNSLSSDPLKVRTDVPSRDGDESLQGARSGRHAPPNGGEALQEGPSNRRAPPNFGARFEELLRRKAQREAAQSRG
ncbi:hypothetical protein WJX84_005187 [Apatococcus fuscideae]|uniref:Uncharacterized protein n=1 Tax=Apatococcus fuscideae TaxID=2026836 RepID=A0AAW1T4Q7_9CHLO